MGLDIYFHKVKKARTKLGANLTIENASELANTEAKEKVQKTADKVLKKMSKLQGKDYEDEYNKAFPGVVRKLTVYKWKYDYMTGKVQDLNTVKEWFDNFVKQTYADCDAYFRKVNFIYRYFSPKLENECCFVTKADLEDLIEKLTEVSKIRGDRRKKLTLEMMDKAADLLPTTSGFFFGSTDYDNWYFADVKDALKQMKHLLKDYNEDEDAIFVVMS